MSVQSIYKKVQISKIIIETENAKTFVLTPVGWVAEYHAGQYITLIFQTPSGEKRRSFSFSSSPLLNEPISITIKKLDNGEFSRQLLYNVREGDILYTSGIGGFFTLRESSLTSQYFFLAAGSGITPCYSLIKTLLARSTAQIVLIYSNRNESDSIFYSELLELSERYKERIRIRFLFSNKQDVYNSRLSNWLLEQLLSQYLIVPSSDAMFYLCGPADYMIMATITLLANGIPSNHVIKENFNPFPRAVIPKPPDILAHTVNLRFNGTDHKLIVQYPKSILAVAKENKISIPYSCEAGRCGSCVAHIISGKIWMAYNEVLMDDEIEKGLTLTCQGFPVEGDVVIEVKE